MSNNCSNLYSPEPDVAGQAVFISFLAHTSVFLVLALVITPIVQLYLPIVRPEDEWREAGEIEPMSTGEAEPSEVESMSTGEVESMSSSAAPPRPEQTIVPGAPGEPPRLIYRCYCREAIQDTYTSQYIAGVAFVVTAFVKITTISYYHLRVIYCLLAMNSIIGVASNFDRNSRLRFWIWSSRAQDRPKSWKMIDFVYLVNLAVFVAFSLFIFLKQDQNFSRCYKYNRGLVLATWIWFSLLSGSTLFYGTRFRSAALWLFFFLAMAGFVGFQSWQIWVLTRTFRKKEVAQGDTNENAFTFGQILVLFMVVPLVGDFTAALMGIKLQIVQQYGKRTYNANHPVVDLRRIEGRTWNDARTAFFNVFRILVPYFVNNVVQEVRDAGRKLINSAFIQRVVNAVVGFTKNSFNRFCKLLKTRNNIRSTKRLYKTNTIRLESQEESINPSLPASPPRSLQLPRIPSRESSHLDTTDGDDGHLGQDQEQQPTNIHHRPVDPVDPEDPDAILPQPGSVRQRQSFPHDFPA